MSSLDLTMQRLGSRFGLTEGQVYTSVIGLLVAGSMAFAAIPPVLENIGVTSASAAPVAVPGLVPEVAPAAPAVPGPAPDVVPEPLAPDAAIAPFAPAGESGSAPTGPTFTDDSAGPVAAGPVAAAPVETPPSASPSGAPPSPTFVRVPTPGAPAGIARTADGRLYISTNNGTARGASAPSVTFEVGASGTLRRVMAVAGQPADHADGLAALSALPDGTLLAVDASTSRVLQIAPSGSGQTVRATIADLPICARTLFQGACEQGLVDRAPQLAGLVVDAAGTAFISDSGQGVIWRLASGASKADLYYSAFDLATGDGPSGIAIDGLGRLLFTVGLTTDAENAGNGGLYSLTPAVDKSAGVRTLVTTFPVGARPGALVVGGSQSAYVVLRGTNEVVSVSSTGESSLPLQPSTGQVPLDAPGGLALVQGELLVTNQGAGATSENWAVLGIPVSDGPMS